MSKNPVDIKLEEGVENDEGAVFVKLETLTELKSFWRDNKEKYSYAAEGIAFANVQIFLNEYEWVFGKTKESVVKMLLRWDEIGVKCEFYDWSEDNPKEFKACSLRRKVDREDCVHDGSWSKEDEAEYQRISKHELQNGYSGWWKIKNLPSGFDLDEWSDPNSMGGSVNDKNLDLEEVNKRMQIRAFDENKDGDRGEVRFYEREGIEDLIEYWVSVKDEGEDYYGSENEAN